MITAHPTIAQLERLAQGTSDDPETTEVRLHLGSCASCRKRYEACCANEELGSDLRDAADRPTKALFPGDGGPADDSRLYPVTDGSIPGHRLVGEIHRGGQGIVYQAVQRGTRRRVAIKVMREGPFSGPQDKARFDREVTILAQLQHPNIVAIHDSGTADGWFYYVMDYISGRPLDKHVSLAKPSIKELLLLFARICDGVNAAHLRGVIHRDLKPSNILVDTEGNPRIVDFGLAKVAMETLPDSEQPQVMSTTGQFLGSLPWASPEQAEAAPGKIDLRTDVYSLGVILYQMLTGQFPYEVVGNMRDVMDNILRTDPVRPSTIRRQIDNDVETIVLKALSKDRERRYQSAGELARDIRHYLKGEPIEAKRDSSWYVLHKTVSRHRARFGAVATFILLVGCFGITVGVLRARANRQAVQMERGRAGDILATFVHDPARALTDVSQAGPRLRVFLAEGAERDVKSPAFTERIVGGRSGLWTNAEAFWKSVNGGPLWQGGEWLELALIDWTDPAPLLAHLKGKAETGTDHEKYVAFCLIGQVARTAASKDASLANLCVSAAQSSQCPGVAAAAWWAARRLGVKAPRLKSRAIRPDDVSGLAFVEVPPCMAFHRGSPASEKDRYKDEAMQEDKPIQAFRLSTTEVTAGALEPFWNDRDTVQWAASQAKDDPRLGELLGEADKELRSQASQGALDGAVAWVSLEVARRFCTWLTARGEQATPPRRYRLPTEDEWEYACRAGNPGRFCFGNHADYVPLFAQCRGYESGGAAVAQRMPNMFGLFDMHGGLWEWCDSQYPAKQVTDESIAAEQKQKLYVLRGGAYYSPAIRCRSAQRNYSDPSIPNRYWGFRVVMELPDE